MDNHLRYFQQCLKLLPQEYVSGDVSKMTLVMFCLGSLDLLDWKPSQEFKLQTIEWIYSQQVIGQECGFKSGSELLPGVPHLTMTYTALQSLLILGDDLKGVDRIGIVNSLKLLQNKDGSFCPTIGEEADMRFVYCACAVSFMLNDWSGINIPLLLDYIKSSRTYEGGYGQGPGLESHGGSTYCAIASLSLMGHLDNLTSQETQETIEWCLSLQTLGFHGRANKADDTCYSFWIGATLDLLDSLHYADKAANAQFLSTTRTKYGGFGKLPGDFPDLLHSYLGLAAQSLFGEDGLERLHAGLNLSQRAFLHLQSLQ